MKVFIDLFSGTGGASQAFDAAPDWTTIKIDHLEELLEHNRGLVLSDIGNVPGTIAIIDTLLESVLNRHGRIDKLVIWASPPCDQFSWARQNGDNPRRMGQTIDDFDMTLVSASRQIIEHYDPNHWVVENVQGARGIVCATLGCTPRQEIGNVILWGDFPLIGIRDRTQWKHRKLEAKGTRKLRPVHRARIPQPISEGLLDAIDRQTTLWQVGW